jgi:FkbM family methyltransferase
VIKAALIHIAHQINQNIRSKAPFTGRGVLLQLADKILSLPPEPMVVKTLYGFKMQIDPVKDKGVEQSIYNTGTYEAGTLHIFDHILCPGDVYFDIGANIGLMTLYASKKVGKSGQVHAFEPQPDTFEILKNNCKINNVKNVFVNEYALGCDEGHAYIYANMDINRGASSLVRQDGFSGKKVFVSTLDKYLSKIDHKKIKLIKIDIEGYEMEMLKGARQLLSSDRAPVICVEYSNDVEHVTEAGDIYDFIKSINKYRVFKFTVWKGEICKLQEVFNKVDLPQHDNIFCFLPDQLAQTDSTLFN